MNASESDRTIGLGGASAIGVGAIVGGGILALSGVAFSTAGPSALLAFMLNGVIALMTALSFAELAAAAPYSGGTYTYAKRVLNVHTAFLVGWIVWFASIVAGVLYALGFSSYAVLVIDPAWQAMTGGPTPEWLVGTPGRKGLAVLAGLAYGWLLLRPTRNGGDWATWGKVAVFGVLILGGAWALTRAAGGQIGGGLQPFFAGGAGGLFQAMGFTFIALQGFDLIPAAAGEIRNPARTIPKAMILSLGIALLIYIPLLFIVSTVGLAPGETAQGLGEQHPESIIAVAASRFLGPAGFWLVVLAALLSMLSALQANLFAASRIALAMARDRTLPRRLSRLSGRGIPRGALGLSTLAILVLVLLIPDVASAGAAASLIFLISFALVHVVCILARHRLGAESLPFRVPLFPLVPVLGGLACVVLVVFQGVLVPSAGLVTLGWMLLGGLVYVLYIARGAGVMDAVSEAIDPHLLRMRGRSPLVLVPMSNPANVEAMVTVANALTPPAVGRVLLLNVVGTDVQSPADERAGAVGRSQAVLGRALLASLDRGRAPESLTTVASDPFLEMARVANRRACESLLLGISQLGDGRFRRDLRRLLDRVSCDVVLLRAPPDWSMSGVKRVLVPMAGKNHHDPLRARFLARVGREPDRVIRFVRVLGPRVSEASLQRVRRVLTTVAREEHWGEVETEVLQCVEPVEGVLDVACDHDLVVIGSTRRRGDGRVIGGFATRLLEEADCAVMVIHHRG